MVCIGKYLLVETDGSKSSEEKEGKAVPGEFRKFRKFLESRKGEDHQNGCRFVSPCDGCFSGSSMVETPVGPIQVSALRLGDSVKTHRPGVGPVYTQFLGWLERHSSASAGFLHLSTASGPGPVLTPGHVIFRASSPAGGPPEPVFAAQLVPGDRLLHGNATEVEVTSVEARNEAGYWAPLTAEGSLLVDGFLASCYASFPHTLSDLALGPVKAFPALLLDNEATQHMDGVRPVVRALKGVGSLLGQRRRVLREDGKQDNWEDPGQMGTVGNIAGVGKHGEL